MSKTSFLNAIGFLDYEEVNNFEGIADKEFQEFIMHYGKNDNKKALLFVREMKNETLKQIEEDIASNEQEEEEWEETQENDEDCDSEDGCAVKAKNKNSNTNKTQHEDLSAAARKAGNMAEVGPGRLTP